MIEQKVEFVKMKSSSVQDSRDTIGLKQRERAADTDGC